MASRWSGFAVVLFGACSSSHDAGHDTPDAAVTADAAPDASGPTGLVAATMSGCYNTHTVPVTIGGLQTFALNVDTGSSSLGVAAASCSACGVTPEYVPGASAVDQHDTVTTRFDTGGAGWDGEAYQDTVAIGGGSGTIKFAAITAMTSYFFPTMCDTPTGMVAAPYQGIIGFGGDPNLAHNTTGFFDALVAGGTPDVFALALCHTGGKLWLGGYDRAAMTADPQTIAMDDSSGFYEVAWNSVAIGNGTPMALTAPHALTDSGGDIMELPDAAFTPVAAALSADAAITAFAGASFFSPTATAYTNCVQSTLTPAQVDAMLPPFVLSLGTGTQVTVSLTATQSYLSYLYGTGGNNSYCQAMIDGKTDLGTIYYLGQSVMLGHVVVHDRVNNQLLIAPSNVCTD